MLIDIAGWIGSVVILVAYGLNTYKKISADSLIFYILNVVGGILLVIYSLYKEAYPNVFINIIWVIIAIPAIITLFRKEGNV
jgi:hypothetical protein